MTKVVTQAAGGNPGQSSRPADIIMQDIGTIQPGTIHILQMQVQIHIKDDIIRLHRLKQLNNII